MLLVPRPPLLAGRCFTLARFEDTSCQVGSLWEYDGGREANERIAESAVRSVPSQIMHVHQSLTSQQKDANLARVRDNERRSRARRKEYLSELESKYQNCERMGVEANAEIQTAARLVLADNKRLRAMLTSLGVSDADMDRSSQTPSAARDLEGMLSQRRPCGGGGAVSCSEGVRSRPAAAVRPLASSSPQPQQQPQLNAPAVEALDRWSHGSRIHATRMNQVRGHRQQPLPEPMSPAHRPVPRQREESPEPPAFEALNRWSDGNRIHATGMNQILGEQQQPPAGSHATSSNSDATNLEAANYAPGNSRSCHQVADAIRMMHPYIGMELEADLGCAGDEGECTTASVGKETSP